MSPWAGWCRAASPTSPRSRRAEAMRDPAWRRRVEAEMVADMPGRRMFFAWDRMSVIRSEHAPETEGRSIAQLCEESGRPPLDVMADLALPDGLLTSFGLAA